MAELVYIRVSTDEQSIQRKSYLLTEAGPVPGPALLEDWKAPLAELRRVLVSRGRLIVVVDHPFLYKLTYPEADYFAVSQRSVEWTFRRGQRPDGLLAPAAARDGRRLHRGGLPDSRHQRPPARRP